MDAPDSRAALELRDSNVRILDVAIKYGFSSQEAEVKIEHIPAHEICGTLESMSHLKLLEQLGQTAGWLDQGGQKGYLYGIPVAADYAGEIPAGMECRDIPESDYLFFSPTLQLFKK